jgi:hypothetical protein
LNEIGSKQMKRNKALMQKTSPDFPLRHLSIRVPWHDAGWAGTVCNAPHLNGACAKLKRIAADKNETTELAIAGKSLEDLSPEQLPCCVHERATFMAPFQMLQTKKHALASKSPQHYGHFRPTLQRYPPYSAGIVPFRWMMRESSEVYADLYCLDLDVNREPDLGYDSPWVHEAGNQTALLDGFAAHMQSDDSLCFFYAKHVPFVEATSRILIGVGRVKQIGPIEEYKREGEGMRGMVWERPIQHSIRPKGKDGFLVPYYDLLARAKEDPALEIERFAAKAPDEHWDEFSYGSELVTHDGAIAALLSIETALGRMESELGIATAWQREWLHDELVRLWKVRGPFPGLGAVLSAFGLSRGLFLAHALQERAGQNADPWPLVDQMFSGSNLALPKELQVDLKELAPVWKKLSAERRSFLALLSRFELTKNQAAALYDDGSRKDSGWLASDRDLIKNPYRLYELTRFDVDRLHLSTIDRGIFPDDTVRLLHPLPEPSRLDSAVDPRRVRAFTIQALEEAANNGHTLLPSEKLVQAIRDSTVRPPCSVTGDILMAQAPQMQPEIASDIPEIGLTLQLERYRAIGDVVRKQVNGRMGGQRHSVPADWQSLLDAKFKAAADAEELRARKEKCAALKELSEARLSVLVGPAGAGKKTVLGILCSRKEISKDGILLLAPTGKARVRMQELVAEVGGKAFTLAQFLNQNGRYEPATGRYLMTDHPPATGFGTVIVGYAR